LNNLVNLKVYYLNNVKTCDIFLEQSFKSEQSNKSRDLYLNNKAKHVIYYLNNKANLNNLTNLEILYLNNKAKHVIYYLNNKANLNNLTNLEILYFNDVKNM